MNSHISAKTSKLATPETESFFVTKIFLNATIFYGKLKP
jgi:hypothetical protein